MATAELVQQIITNQMVINNVRNHGDLPLMALFDKFFKILAAYRTWT